MTPDHSHDNSEEAVRMRNYTNISLTDLYHSLQRQGESVTDLKKQLEPLAELATNIRLLTQQMESVNTELNKFEMVRDQVTVHKTVHWILGAVCSLVFPVLVAWNFQLNSDLRAIQSDLDKANEKIHALERVTYVSK